MNTLLCLGFGYCAEALARRLPANGNWRITGTARTPGGAKAIAAKSFEGLVFDGATIDASLEKAILQATHILVSAPPDADGDPVLHACQAHILASKSLTWLGYLSTIGVYGDSGGAWVDEDTPPRPTHERAARRLAAESSWIGQGAQIFRIAGIYGPGRNALADLREGTARRIVKPGQVFNRIHVADIAQCLDLATRNGRAGRVYNLTDDEPASPEAVFIEAARLLGLPPPAAIPFERAELSPMAASFYTDNRRVRNDRIKTELKVSLRYPSYHEGLAGLLAEINR